MAEPTGREREGKYVLAHIGATWHVMFSPKDLPHHYVSVARFQDYRRAKTYAEVEDRSHSDFPGNGAADVMAVPPIQTDAIKVEKREEPRPDAPPPRSDLRRPLTELEVEMRDDLPELMKKHATGVSVADFVSWYGEPKERVEEAMRALHDRGLAVGMRSLGDGVERLVPKGFCHPPASRNEAQDRLLQAMCELQSDGVVKASHRMLAEKSGVPLGSLPVTLATLIGSGAVVRVVDGAPQIATTYRVTTEEKRSAA